VQRVKDKVGEILVPGNQAPWSEVCGQLSRLLRGWRCYFDDGSRQRAYETVDHHVYHCVQRFLVRRHKVPTHGTRRFTYRAVYGVLGVPRLVPRCHDATPWASG
jgi:RNA-directed DNA polymerase